MLEPEAWLIREIKGNKASVLYGYMFKSKETADAAALRLTNSWRLCLAFPVVSLANAEGAIASERFQNSVDE